ncbi:MAG: hypothetical protein EKE20_14735 [Candidatus Symbiopectobacterium sp. Dall1.0]|nr:hypothetical protein [Candidatus Symbiopectobacterium sp. Dall1.0]
MAIGKNALLKAGRKTLLKYAEEKNIDVSGDITDEQLVDIVQREMHVAEETQAEEYDAWSVVGGNYQRSAPTTETFIAAKINTMGLGRTLGYVLDNLGAESEFTDIIATAKEAGIDLQSVHKQTKHQNYEVPEDAYLDTSKYRDEDGIDESSQGYYQDDGYIRDNDYKIYDSYSTYNIPADYNNNNHFGNPASIADDDNYIGKPERTASNVESLRRLIKHLSSDSPERIDVLGRMEGHDNTFLYDEFMVNQTQDINDSLRNLASVYLDKDAYKSEKLYQHDSDRLYTRLAKLLPERIKATQIQIAQEKGNDKWNKLSPNDKEFKRFTSYFDAIPAFHDKEFLSGIRHPKPALTRANTKFIPGWEKDLTIHPSVRNEWRQRYSQFTSMTGMAEPNGGWFEDKEKTIPKPELLSKRSIIADVMGVAGVYGIGSKSTNDGKHTGITPYRHKPYELQDIRNEAAILYNDQPDFIDGDNGIRPDAYAVKNAIEQAGLTSSTDIKHSTDILPNIGNVALTKGVSGQDVQALNDLDNEITRKNAPHVDKPTQEFSTQDNIKSQHLDYLASEAKAKEEVAARLAALKEQAEIRRKQKEQAEKDEEEADKTSLRESINQYDNRSIDEKIQAAKAKQEFSSRPQPTNEQLEKIVGPFKLDPLEGYGPSDKKSAPKPELDDKDAVTYHDNLKQGSDEWLAFRKKYLTATEAGRLLHGYSTFKTQEKIDADNLSKVIINKIGDPFSKTLFNSDMKRGYLSEPIAREWFDTEFRALEKEYGREYGAISETGAVTNKNYPNLSASPDGLIGDDGILEFKDTNGKLEDIPREHPYRDQVQQNMLLTGRKYAMLVQSKEDWSKPGFVGTKQYKRHVQRVEFEPDWYENNKDKLNAAFDTYQSVKENVPEGQVANDELVKRMAEAVKIGNVDANEIITEKKKQQANLTSASKPTSDNGSSDSDDATTSVIDGGGGGGKKASGGGSGGGNGSGSASGGFWGNPRDALESAYGGVASGTLNGLGGGLMGALAKLGPVGRIAGATIGAAGIYGETVDWLNDEAGSALDSGITNIHQYTASRHNLEISGLGKAQAITVTNTLASANALLEAGNPSLAAKIVSGSQGLITLDDFREWHNDPSKIVALASKRAKKRGIDQTKFSGLMLEAGLPGAGRVYNNSAELELKNEFNSIDAKYKESKKFTTALEAHREYTKGDFNPRFGALKIAEDHLDKLPTGADFTQAFIDLIKKVNKKKEEFDDRLGKPRNSFDDKIDKNVIRSIESGGNDYDKLGNILTSDAGAKASMQVLPSTAKKPGYGITPAKDNSPIEYNRVGRELLSKLMERYGNVDKAIAAYNAGGRRVDNLIEMYGNEWLQFAPKETQDYVKKYHKFATKEINDINKLNSIKSYTSGNSANRFSTSKTDAKKILISVDMNIKGDTVEAKIRQNGKVVQEKKTLINRSVSSQKVS